MKKIVALFDFDGTIIRGNSLPRFLLYYSGPFRFIVRSVLLLPVFLKYLLRMIDEHAAKEYVYVCFIAGEKRSRFMERARRFSLEVIPSLVKEEAAGRVLWHKEKNHVCLLVSASVEEYLAPWAGENGFSKVISTRLDVDKDGIMTGRLSGRNCRGREKVRRVREYLGPLEQYEIYAYGDSSGDRELLAAADHPFYKSFSEETECP